MLVNFGSRSWVLVSEEKEVSEKRMNDLRIGGKKDLILGFENITEVRVDSLITSCRTLTKYLF